MPYNDLFIRPGDILLPKEDVNMTLWASVACDQFTSQPEYWQEVALQVGALPSTSKLILPECFLEEASWRIPAIHSEMRAYLSQGLLETKVHNGFVLTERSTGSGARIGLVLLLDLEGYDYKEGSQSLIRASEGTVLSRVPPRMEVRRDAVLEMSHVLMLLEDPMSTVIEPLYEKRNALPKLYDFPLMMNGGHVTGYAVTAPEDIQHIYQALASLKAQLPSENPLLYAVGDGNHSLAAAKGCWEEIKPTLSPALQANHPARFALVELTNLFDPAIIFEPIHRVVTGYDGDLLMEELNHYVHSQGMLLGEGPNLQEICCVFEGKQVTMCIGGSPNPLAVGTLQAFLDEWMKNRPGVAIDYVHGEEAVRKLAEEPNAVGFLLPKPSKQGLFATLHQQGVLPRKTFSMGEPHEKRYYLETRQLL